eukprot:SAG31_NODE_3177_length_4584_cov_10.428999_3_plen_173_part_00
MPHLVFGMQHYVVDSPDGRQQTAVVDTGVRYRDAGEESLNDLQVDVVILQGWKALAYALDGPVDQVSPAQAQGSQLRGGPQACRASGAACGCRWRHAGAPFRVRRRLDHMLGQVAELQHLVDAVDGVRAHLHQHQHQHHHEQLNGRWGGTLQRRPAAGALPWAASSRRRTGR